jgi:Uma2 family endonuclease
MGEAATQLMTVEEYLAFEERSEVKHEYLGGVIYAMSGAKNAHNDIAMSALGSFFTQLRGNTCKPFNSDTKIRIRHPDYERLYYPDAGVTCRPNPPEDTFHDFPVILVEVLSPSTRRTDETEKRDAYFMIPTLESYLLVDSEKVAVTLYTRTPTGFQRRDFSELEDSFELGGELKLKLSVSELYERVSFEG